MKVMAQIAMVMNLDKCSRLPTPVPSPVSRCGRTVRAPSTSGSTTSKPVPAWATPAAGRTRRSGRAAGSVPPRAASFLVRADASPRSRRSSRTRRSRPCRTTTSRGPTSTTSCSRRPRTPARSRRPARSPQLRASTSINPSGARTGTMTSAAPWRPWIRTRSCTR